MSIYIYLFLFGAFTFFLPIRKKYKISLSFLFSLAMILVAGFRGDDVGTDTIRYAYSSYRDTAGFSLEYKSSIELLWNFILKIIDQLGLPTYYILLVSSFITVLTVFYACLRNSSNIALSMFIFYCLYFFVSLNGVRQMLAASLILLGYTYLLKGCTKKFVLATLFATGVHTSSCFVLVSIIVTKFKFLTKSNMIIIPIACYIMGFLGFDRIFEFVYSYFGSYQQYIGENTFYINWSIGGILYNVFTLGISIYVLLSDKSNNWKIKQLYFLFVCFSMLFLNSFIFQRFALTFGFIQMLFYPHVLDNQTPNKRRLLLISILFLLCFNCFNSLLRGFNEIVPYQVRINF